MKNELETLVASLDSYLEGEKAKEELSQGTLSVISNDGFDELEENVQDAVYVLDNKDLNSLTREDVQKLRGVIIGCIESR